MTFGEHLEELRRALMKSLIWLVLGFAVGLLVGHRVVDFIKLPLVDALRDVYAGRSAEVLIKLQTGEERASNDKEVMALAKQLNERGFIVEEYFVDPQSIRQALEQPQSNTPSDPMTEAAATTDQIDGPEANPSAINDNLAFSADKLVPLPLWKPITKDQRIDPSAFGVSEAFMFYLKASLLAGFVFASPLIFREMWMFVASGLYPHERRYVHVFLPFSILLFLGGSLFCFFIVFQFVLGFLFGFNEWLGITIQPRISEWLSFALILPLAFGISFQLPLVMLFLQRIRVCTIELYIAKWRIAILVIAVISMLLTPTDPMSMLAMLVPLTFLYFGGILLCKYMPAGKGLLDE